jgi:hypothetical protein
MVQNRKNLVHGCFQKGKINQHSAFAEVGTHCPDPHLVVVAVKPFAFAVVMEQPVSGRETAFNPYLVHKANHILEKVSGQAETGKELSEVV